jgi:hypothetical protein
MQLIVINLSRRWVLSFNSASYLIVHNFVEIYFSYLKHAQLIELHIKHGEDTILE